ncbi:MAG TPA: carbohydrate porin [Pseudolabrys sp.]|uniref:carbohydrate porin n=1 Tax=Pseudolabrys sp. TaxID=1960880 RepID=UPI002DDD1570|nr:carbohydrate porin [Pseudolabrys sp.]HEV2628027.1 carbohydrate porin [Pseudolabrys sp.]
MIRGVAITAMAALSLTGARAADAPKAPKSIWEQDTLTGDWGGARTALKDKGVDLTLTYINEAFGVLGGGLSRRSSYEGRFEFSVDTDLQKLVGWDGATTHVTVYQLHNGGHDAVENAGSISDPSNIDALATTRLFTAWFQQNAFDDRVSLRIGQIAADDEFLNSQTASGLINGTFGWADVVAANMLNGGPAFPLATPGVRLAVKPTDALTVQTAVFSGNPAGGSCTDTPQQCNRYGTTFSFSGGALWMGELQYAINQGKDAVGLPGVYKLGGWYATADFNDLHYGLDASGTQVSLGVDSNATPLTHKGNSGIYGVADQMVWRGKESSLNFFLRGGFAPSDRNLVSYYVDAGAGLKGPLPGRPDDTLTFGVAYAKISKDIAAVDQDTVPAVVVRDYEAVFELNYALQVAPWWTVQPDLQYIVHPNDGQNPNDPTQRLGNAFLAGIRSTIKF